jgi:pyridoxal phosphate enzyme (YggS family)
MSDGLDRREQIQRGLDLTEERISAACHAAGRDRGDVHLIVVTKTWPVEDLRVLAELGVREVGENKAGDLADKRQQLAGAHLTWHFIGQLQSNKARLVAQHADVVQSIDRPKLIAVLSREREGAREEMGWEGSRPLECLVQVSLDVEPTIGRGGATPTLARELADQIAGSPGLRLRGVMGVAPLEGSARGAFERLRDVADLIRADHPDAIWISAGMSGDLEEAVAEGATHLRVGSAILGSRSILR